MNLLKPLVMMQIRDKLDFSFLSSKKQTIFKIVFAILGFVVVTGLCYVVLWACSLLKLFSLSGKIPLSVMVVIYTVMLLLSTINCSVGLMQSLFYAKDNPILLTLPVAPNMVYISKLLVYFFFELKKNLYFTVPLFVAYGILCEYPIYFYPWLVLCFLLLTALPVALGGVLSMPLIVIDWFLKRFTAIRFALLAIVAGLGIWLVYSLINIIPSNINIVNSWGKLFWRIQDFLNLFVVWVSPITYIITMVCGRQTSTSIVMFSGVNFIVLACVVVLLCVLLAINFFASRPMFFRSASKSFEFGKEYRNTRYKNNFHRPLTAGTIKEFKLARRDSSYNSTILTVLLALPFAILLLNKIFSAMNTRLEGTYMTMSVNVLLMLVVLLTSNISIASSYSREGRAGYITKTEPVKYSTALLPKLMLNSITAVISTVACLSIFQGYAKLEWYNVIFLFFIITLTSIGHLFWSAEMDIMNPQNEQYATTGSQVTNPNENKSAILAFVLAFVVFGITLFLLDENSSIAWVKVFAISVAFCALRVFLYFNRVKLYFGEK